MFIRDLILDSLLKFSDFKPFDCLSFGFVVNFVNVLSLHDSDCKTDFALIAFANLMALSVFCTMMLTWSSFHD